MTTLESTKSFNLERYLAQIDERLLTSPEGRKALTRLDPLLFGLVYLKHHLRGPETNDRITLAPIHLEWAEYAKTWIRPLSSGRGPRDAYIAPRSVGKSSWHYLILPLWGAAHGFLRFVAGFSDTSTQAETHLATLKHELDTNTLLQADYPTLCKIAVRPRGVAVADSRSLMVCFNGFTFSAKGADSSTLGLKVGNARPDLLTLDDVEPGESNYSIGAAEKRLRTIEDVILPLRESARVIMVGTATMRGSLIDDLVKSVTTNETAEWIRDTGFTAHYYPGIVTNDDGTESSIWPERWSLDYLQSIRHTRSFALSFMSQPIGLDSQYWYAEDLRVGQLVSPTLKILSVDPAVTNKIMSDRTGLAVVQYSHSEKRFEVVECIGVRLRGSELRTAILGILARHPDCKRVICEGNQGQDLWHEVLHDLPCKLLTFSVHEPKPVRFSRLLNHYQRGRVLHTRHHDMLEGEMLSYPASLYDDCIDSVCNAVGFLEQRAKPRGPAMQSASYV